MHKIVEVFNFTVLTHRQVKAALKNSTYTVLCKGTLNYRHNRKVPAAHNKRFPFAHLQT